MAAYLPQCRALSPAASFASLRTNAGSNSSSTSRATSPDSFVGFGSFGTSSYLHEGAPAQTPRGNLQPSTSMYSLHEGSRAQTPRCTLQPSQSKSRLPIHGMQSARSLESSCRSAATYTRRVDSHSSQDGSMHEPLATPRSATPLATPRMQATPRLRREASCKQIAATPRREISRKSLNATQVPGIAPDSRTVRLVGQTCPDVSTPRPRGNSPTPLQGRKGDRSLAAHAGRCLPTTQPRKGLQKSVHTASADATRFQPQRPFVPNSKRISPSHISLNIDMRRFLAPGDIFFVKDGETALARIGTSGGFLGHVLQVIGSPHCIFRDDVEAFDIQSVWPAGVDKIWAVKTMESTRDIEGLHEAYSLIYIDPDSHSIIMLGQEDLDGHVCVTNGEAIEVWQPPMELRSQFMVNVMYEVIADMRNSEASWSFGTAVRAVFMSATIASSGDKNEIMADIQSAWTVEPICTSVVIVFWQRYLSKAAQLVSLGSAPSAVTQSQVCSKAVDLIRRFMPLKADRGLPGDLQSAMRCCGWRCMTKLC